MLSTFEILLPVFALILAGFLCRKRKVLGPTAASELNKFVVWLGLPALLFDTMAHASWTDLYQPAFTAVFTLSALAVMVFTLIWRVASGRHLPDASVDAIAASYSNTGYLGFPLCLILFGDVSKTPTTIATIVVACVMFAAAIILIEIGLQTERQPHKLGFKVLKSLLKNPLIVSPIVGAAASSAHLHIGDSVDTFLKLLSSAASPCALVSLGAFLAEKRPSTGLKPVSLALVALKLVVQPLLAWWLATRVFSLSPILVELAVILAALPTGTGPFMLAEFYKREAVITSQTILITTLLSLVTLSLLMAFMGHAI